MGCRNERETNIIPKRVNLLLLLWGVLACVCVRCTYIQLWKYEVKYCVALLRVCTCTFNKRQFTVCYARCNYSLKVGTLARTKRTVEPACTTIHILSISEIKEKNIKNVLKHSLISFRCPSLMPVNMWNIHLCKYTQRFYTLKCHAMKKKYAASNSNKSVCVFSSLFLSFFPYYFFCKL